MTFQALGTRLVAISADDATRSESFRTEMNLPMDLLCDIDRKVIKQYRLLNPHEHGGIAYPAMFVIKSDGTIGYRSLDRTANRVNISDVVIYLEKLKADPGYAKQSDSKKPFIVPSPKYLVQFFRNMLLRGSKEDWKHHLSFPVNAIRLLYKNRRR